VQFSSGIIIGDIAVHRRGEQMWASPPARPWIEDNELARDDRGKPKYQTVIGFVNHGVRASWSRQVIAALRDAHPDLFQEWLPIERT
jgi:DNA-binding transcriptional LysR family regulator